MPTPRGRIGKKGRRISIHGTLAGADQREIIEVTGFPNFNPRHPCGCRPSPRFGRLSCFYFNPRHPCGCRPALSKMEDPLSQFQSTAPLRVPTGRQLAARFWENYFNPRHPCGCRLDTIRPMVGTSTFQSTAPLRVPTAGWHKKRVKKVVILVRPAKKLEVLLGAGGWRLVLMQSKCHIFGANLLGDFCLLELRTKLSGRDDLK